MVMCIGMDIFHHLQCTGCTSASTYLCRLDGRQVEHACRVCKQGQSTACCINRTRNCTGCSTGSSEMWFMYVGIVERKVSCWPMMTCIWGRDPEAHRRVTNGTRQAGHKCVQLIVQVNVQLALSLHVATDRGVHAASGWTAELDQIQDS
jgi:hypothetical protein